MKIVFIYPDFMKGTKGKYYEGIASLSAVLKENGYKTDAGIMLKIRKAGRYYKYSNQNSF